MKQLSLLISLLILCTGLMAQVLIYGDTRNHPEVHRELVSTVQDSSFSLIFHTGDLNRKGILQSEYDEFKSIIAPLKGRFYPVRGNHERDLELYLENFPQPASQSFYTVIHDSLQYIILDSVQDMLPGTVQYHWLKQQLEAYSLPKILLLHHPIFSSGPHGDELGLSLFLPALLKNYNVKLVFSGHEHSFEHLLHEGIHYVVTGGGGAPLRDLKQRDAHSLFFLKVHHYSIMNREAGKLKLNTFDLSGQQIHQTTIDL